MKLLYGVCRLLAKKVVFADQPANRSRSSVKDRKTRKKLRETVCEVSNSTGALRTINSFDRQVIRPGSAVTAPAALKPGHAQSFGFEVLPLLDGYGLRAPLVLPASPSPIPDSRRITPAAWSMDRRSTRYQCSPACCAARALSS